ncbi:MAG: phosphonate C-P lyase system protein PhnH [Deltaproteobacteria bacterium]|jgi:alpha-D-ribose 1-methylphosphonate 5-triphosphate synthase subunit PhnH|nr:phosphonate C-P lyase system protein PhnH [Deltaproteobacteria bacterium]
MIDAKALAPGFDDYVVSSQRVFRLALAGLSRPCLAWELNGVRLAPQTPLPPLAAALALTLLDSATPVWLSASWRQAADWLRFHRGCPVREQADEAAFVLAASPAELPPLSALNQGSERYPDSSATVVLGSVMPLDGQRAWLAKGPGIDGSIIFRGHGLDDDFLEQWRLNRASYPLGTDVLLAGDKHLAGLPRSVSLEEWPGGDRACM